MITDAWIPRADGSNVESRYERRGCHDHRRESVVQTGGAASLAGECERRAPGSHSPARLAGLRPSSYHVLTHVVTWRAMLLAVVLCGSSATLGLAVDGPAIDRARAMIKDLEAENVEVRRAAAVGIRSSPRDVQRASVPELIDRLMKDTDGQVRLAVLDTLFALERD